MTRSRGLAGRAAPYLLGLLLAAPSVLAFDPNFDFYPKDAQPCLLSSAKASNCEGDTAADLNSCLCGNGGSFVIRSAQCLGQKDKKDVEKVYDTMADACATSKTPLKVDKDDFLDAADDAADDAKTSTKTTSTKTSTKTSSSATKTPNSTSASSTSASSTSAASTTAAKTSSTASPSTSPDASKGDGEKKKLSTAGTIGIAAGVSIAGVAAIAGLAFFLVRRRKRNTADEAHPMLPPTEKYGGGGGATTFPPHDPSPSIGGGGFDHETKSHYSVSTFSGTQSQQQQQRQSYAALSNASPDPQQHNFLSAWEPPVSSTSYNTSPSNAQYVGPYAAPQGVAELPPQTHQVVAELPPQTQPVHNVFELDSHGANGPPPPPPQASQQPVAQQQQQQQQPPREYRPYVPR